MRKSMSFILLRAGSLLVGGAQLFACPTEEEVRNFFLRNSYADKSSALTDALGLELKSANGNIYKITAFDPPNSTLDYQAQRDEPATTTESSCKYKLSGATLAAAGKEGAFVVFEKK